MSAVWVHAARLVQEKKLAAERAEKQMLEAAVPIANAVLHGWTVLEDRLRRYETAKARYEQAEVELRAALAYRDSIKRSPQQMVPAS